MNGQVAHRMEQITSTNVLHYLADRGVGTRSGAAVTELTGGVSGRCILVCSDEGRLVVKQALEQLSVASTWIAKPERAVTEASALELLHAITPAATPALVDVDPQRCALTMSAAPADYVSWKDVLLDGTMGNSEIRQTAGRLGVIVGQWHRQTWQHERIAASFCDYEAFEQLRVTPFHRVIATRHPDLADPIETCVTELLTVRQCLVHGDFSPKNVLVGVVAPWVVDFEVAHFGAAVFDLAFLQCHLILKAVHQPGRTAGYRAAAAHFLARYHDTCPLSGSPALLGWHTACLLLARIDGTSPATYLTDRDRVLVRTLAAATLSSPAAEISGLWDSAERIVP